MFKRLYQKILPAGIDKLFSTEDSRKEAVDAETRAARDLETAVARKKEVTEVATQLRLQRERNSFADLIERTMRGAG